jgi:hypothetical protein
MAASNAASRPSTSGAKPDRNKTYPLPLAEAREVVAALTAAADDAELMATYDQITL